MVMCLLATVHYPASQKNLQAVQSQHSHWVAHNSAAGPDIVLVKHNLPFVEVARHNIAIAVRKLIDVAFVVDDGYIADDVVAVSAVPSRYISEQEEQEEQERLQ